MIDGGGNGNYIGYVRIFAVAQILKYPASSLSIAYIAACRLDDFAYRPCHRIDLPKKNR
jgi:hypothetical protein